MTTSTTYIFPGRKRGKKEIKMSSNYAFVASLSTTSPPGNNFVGLVVVPKNQASSCLSAVAAVVLTQQCGVSREKQKPAHFVVLWRNNNTFFLQHWHTYTTTKIHTAPYSILVCHTYDNIYWKKSEMIWNFANNKALSRSSHIEY